MAVSTDRQRQKLRQHTCLPRMEPRRDPHKCSKATVTRKRCAWRAANGRKNTVNMRKHISTKNYVFFCSTMSIFVLFLFLLCLTSEVRFNFSNNMHSGSIHWVSFEKKFAASNFHVFDSMRRAHTKKKCPFPGTHISTLGPKPPKDISTGKSGTKKSPVQVLEEPKGPMTAHPARLFHRSSLVSVLHFLFVAPMLLSIGCSFDLC